MTHDTHDQHSSEWQIAAISIGDPQEWADLYTEQARLDARLDSVGADMMAASESIETAIAGLSSASGSADPSGILSATGEAASLAEQLVTLQQCALEVYQNVTAIYGQAGFKEWELGTELEPIPPASYVTRAIGEPSEVVSKRYRQIRAEIEVFRQLTGETRENVTLGLGNGESWSQNRLENFVLNIQRLQMAQIMLSDNPTELAERFGKSEVIERLGVPPKVALEELPIILEGAKKGIWLHSVIKVCAEIEPLDQGLTIDRNP